MRAPACTLRRPECTHVRLSTRLPRPHDKALRDGGGLPKRHRLSELDVSEINRRLLAMNDSNYNVNTDPLPFKREEGGNGGLKNQTTRRTFLQAAGLGAAALAAHGVAY